MSTPFANPAGMDGLPLDELEGSLLIFEPTERVDDINTVHGVQWAVKATVTVVDGDNAGETYVDTLVFPRVLKNSILKQVGTGTPVLGRLGKGQASQKGHNKPWILEDPSDADTEAAIKVWNARTPF